MKDDFSVASRVAFRAKAAALAARRMARDGFERVPRHAPRPAERTGAVLSEIRTPLYTEGLASEQGLQLGKVQNLRIASRTIDGAVVPEGQVFSFWRQVGRPTRAKGYVEGRELRQGCLIPTIAGGICQLSNSLYHVARHGGMEIVERHQHSAPVADAAFAHGEDATVFWNYIDFRFRATRDVIVRAGLTGEELVVRLEAAE